MHNRERLTKAFSAFDCYNANDPNVELVNNQAQPKELIYANRMTERLARYAPDAPEHVQLAARCQHIGRWELPRNSYPMDKKGYLQWRSTLKLHHATIAQDILKKCGYESAIIEKVKALLLKKELQTNAETKLIEDVICLVFIEFYLDDFASQHDDEKVIDILRKTLKKMTVRAIEEAKKLSISSRIAPLVGRALEP